MTNQEDHENRGIEDERTKGKVSIVPNTLRKTAEEIETPILYTTTPLILTHYKTHKILDFVTVIKQLNHRPLHNLLKK